MWGALVAAGLVLVGGAGLAHGTARFPVTARFSVTDRFPVRDVFPVRDELRVVAAAEHRHGAALPDAARVGPLFGADGHHCTASVVGADLILTAAHCAPAGKDFVPGYRGGHSPHGRWHVTRQYVPQRWTDGQDEDYDVAFAEVAPHGEDHLGDVVGYHDLGFDAGFGVPVTVTGYPTHRSRPVTGHGRTGRYSAHQMRVRVRGLAGGTSGSPWIDSGGEVIGVIGGHQEGGAEDDVSYSVYFGDRVAALYDSVDLGLGLS